MNIPYLHCYIPEFGKLLAICKKDNFLRTDGLILTVINIEIFPASNAAKMVLVLAIFNHC